MTPDSLQYYLEDTWHKITLYENKTETVSATLQPDSTYLVKLDIQTAKLYADSLGMEMPANYEGDYIDIGIFAADDTDKNGRTRTNPIYLKKHKLAAGAHTLEIRVDELPAKAGIDPYNKLIDRIPDDNLISVDLE